MRVVVCGSLAFFEHMQEVRDRLEAVGHEVVIPAAHVDGEDGRPMPVDAYYALKKRSFAELQWMWERKEHSMRDYLREIDACDAVLVLNLPKNGVDGYIGANTLIEMGVAFHLSKPILLLCDVPDAGHTEEILSMRPQVLHGDLSALERLQPDAAIATA